MEAIWMGADRPRVQTSPKLPPTDPPRPSSRDRANGTQERESVKSVEQGRGTPRLGRGPGIRDEQTAPGWRTLGTGERGIRTQSPRQPGMAALCGGSSGGGRSGTTPHGARASGHDAQVRGEAGDSTSGPEKNGSAEAQLGVRGRQARSPGVTGSSTRGA